MGKRLTHEEVSNVFKDAGYKLLDNYIKNSVAMKCSDKYGYLYNVRYGDLRNGSYPQKVSRINPYTMQNINNYLKINNINQTLVSKTYKSSSDKMWWHCPVHNKDYQQSWVKFDAGHRCQKCGYNITSQKSRKSQEDFISEAIAIHGDKYDYSNTVYKGGRKEVKIFCHEPNHGYFELLAQSHTSGIGCSKCSDNFKMNGSEFIRKSILKHGDKYDYSKVCFIDRDTDVEIVCTELGHDFFWQSPNNHLRNSVFDKCPKCYSDSKNGGSGWSRSEWKRCGEKSKNFESYKLYIIRCFNEYEEFIKVGITFRSIKERFSRKARMPYKHEVLSIIKDNNSDIIFDLEREIHKKLKEYNLKHTPEITFDGSTECFESSEIVLKIINNITNNIS